MELNKLAILKYHGHNQLLINQEIENLILGELYEVNTVPLYKDLYIYPIKYKSSTDGFLLSREPLIVVYLGIHNFNSDGDYPKFLWKGKIYFIARHNLQIRKWKLIS